VCCYSVPGSARKVYIDRRAAMEHRSDPSADPDCRNTVFHQLFEGLKPREGGQKPLDYRHVSTVCAHRIQHTHTRPFNGPLLLYTTQYFVIVVVSCLQCFGAVGWAAGRASGLYRTEWWDAGVVICVERGADLHMAQLMPLPLTVSCFSTS